MFTNIFIYFFNIKLIYFRDQPINDGDNTEITTTKKVSVVEKCLEPEKVFMDSFITEGSDGRKVNVTRKISSRKVKRIIYLEQVTNFYQSIKA